MKPEEQKELDRPIIADTVGNAHEKVVKAIYQYYHEQGKEITTQDDEVTIEWPFPLTVHITTPLKEPMRSECYKFGGLSCEEYKEQLLKVRALRNDPSLPDFNYMYSQLYQGYPVNSAFLCSADHYREDNWEPGQGINQIEGMCQRIAEALMTRRAVAMGWVPQWFSFPLPKGFLDGFGKPLKDDPPCLDMLQALVREEDGELRLNLIGIFRSNDMLTAWGANAYAIAFLQEYMVFRINQIVETMKHPLNYVIRKIVMGYLRTQSNSAHIYYVRDKSDLPAFRQKGNY